MKQLYKISTHIEDTALQKGPDFFHPPNMPPPVKPIEDNDMYRYYFMLDRSSKESVSFLNIDFILLDKDKNIIRPFLEDSFSPPVKLSSEILSRIGDLNKIKNEKNFNFRLSSIDYSAVIKPVYDKNSFGLGWIIIYSSLEKINQLQLIVNMILLIIVVFSAIIIIIFSSFMSRKISEPFSHLSEHIGSIAERNFENKINFPVYDELKEVINGINLMSEKLEVYDKAQKTFLQNVSHEFRTPLMSIQSYAEGIQYEVVDEKIAANIILNETKRITSLVEDILYLSRLEAIEEVYHHESLDFSQLLQDCIHRLSGIALNANIQLVLENTKEEISIYGDPDKLSRAIINVVGNCMRYAKNLVTVSTEIIDNKRLSIIISDDGPGFDPNELPYVFDRFYKGKQGNFGLGLAISKNILEKHNGKISAYNTSLGAAFRLELPII